MSNRVKIYTLKRGIPFGRHEVQSELSIFFQDAEVVPDIVPYATVCELPINPKTGKSKTCEHRVAFKWDKNE